MNKSNETTPEPGHLEIAKRAYELWENDGRRPGRDQHYWFMAEAALRSVTPISHKELVTEPKTNGEVRTKRKGGKSVVKLT